MSTRLFLGLNLLLYYSWWTAEFEKGRHLIGMPKPLASKEDLVPLPRIAWHATEAIYYWITAENAAALHAAEEGLKFAEASGVHLWDFMLLAQGVWATVTANDLAGAEAALVRLRSILDPQRHLDVIQYYTLAFCIAQQRNDTQFNDGIRYGKPPRLATGKNAMGRMASGLIARLSAWRRAVAPA